MKRSTINIPVSERYCMTVEEAAAYSLIGENKLRDIIHNNKYQNFLLWIGNTVRIKRKQFEQYLEGLNYL